MTHDAPDRCHSLRPDTAARGPVVYVMSRDQRVLDNHALLESQRRAGGEPVYVQFNLQRAGLRRREHFEFMLAGLREAEAGLRALGIPLLLTLGDAVENISAVARALAARAVVVDFNPLQRERDIALRERLECGLHVVDTHNVVPAWVLSDKREFAAHTIRRKVHRHLAAHLVEPPRPTGQAWPSPGPVGPFWGPDARGAGLPGIVTWAEAEAFVAGIDPCGIRVAARPGEAAAREHVAAWVGGDWAPPAAHVLLPADDLLAGLDPATLDPAGLAPARVLRLAAYAGQRNDPLAQAQSGLSPYLHFGHVSALRVALEVLRGATRPPLLFEEPRLAQAGEVPSRDDGMDALFEEMIVRKELADNFCFYGTTYTSLAGTHEWAQQTLAEHARDPREFVYERDEWEAAATHDPAWNAAQRQLRATGVMHGYLRMYWAKKMLEWSRSPEAALADCIALNDTYSIDGGDPNGYVGILWSIGGLHDRPWAERSVFGKVRYMNAAGLRRKFALDAYVARWGR